MPRKISDTALIAALLECDTQKEAAKRLHVSPQAVCARMKDSTFLEAYNKAQRELLRETTRKLANASAQSAELLIKTMKDEAIELSVRLGIARDILRLSRDFTALDELTRRVEQIELKDKEEREAWQGSFKPMADLNED